MTTTQPASPDPTSPPTSTAPPSARAVPRPLQVAVLVTTALAAVIAIGAPWLPQLDHALSETVLGRLFGAGPAAVVLAVTALLGALAALAALAGILPRAALLATAALEMLVVGVGMGSTSILSMAGYLLALAMPYLVGLVLVQSIRRYPRARPALIVATALALGAGALFLGRPLVELLGSLLPAVVAVLPWIGFTLLLVAVGALWAAAAVLALRGGDGARRATAWVTRRRVLFTVLAACGPLPYALARLTWLTPWPQLAPVGTIDLTTRLWGLMLSSGCWLAVLLTLGLLRPWGEVFPRWMPVVAGRPVPIAAAAVPGSAIAALLSFAAVPLLVGAAAQGQGLSLVLTFALVFPCWLWGPALALAVWGYVGHRLAPQRRAPAAEAAGAGAP